MNIFSIAFLPFLHVPTQAETFLLQVNQQVNERTEYQIKLNMTAYDPSGAVVGSADGAMHVADRVTARTAEEIQYRGYTAASYFKSVGVLEATGSALAGVAGLDYTKKIRLDGGSVEGAMPGGVTSSIDLKFSPKSVAVGDTWTSEISPGFQMLLNVTYKLESMSGTEYKVSALIAKTDQFVCIEPYVFMVDRKTGRYKTCTGALQVNAEEGKLIARFSCRRILPALPQLYGKD